MKKLNVKEMVKRMMTGFLFIMIGSGFIGLSDWIETDDIILFQWISFGIVIVGIVSFLMAFQTVKSAYNLIDNKNLIYSYGTVKKSSVLVGSNALSFSVNTPKKLSKILKPQKKEHYISKLDQTFYLTRVNGMQISNRMVPGWIIYKFLHIGYDNQIMKRIGKNGKPLGGFSLNNWRGIEWCGKTYRYQWRWSKSKWSTVMAIVKFGCIQYYNLTGIALATGIRQRQTFVLLVDPVYTFDALCVSLLRDPHYPERNWHWLAEIMPPPDKFGKEM